MLALFRCVFVMSLVLVFCSWCIINQDIFPMQIFPECDPYFLKVKFFYILFL